MSSYERFFKAINREEPDRLPMMELEVEKSVIDKLYSGIDILDFYEKIGLDSIVVFEDIPWIEVSPFIKKDHFGVLRDFRELDGVTWPFPYKELINKNTDLGNFLKNYKPPDPNDPRRLKTLERTIKRFKGEKAIVFGMHSSFIYVSFIRGFENLLMDYILNPDFAKALTEIVVNYFKQLTKNAIEMGADAIIDCEDYCGKNGPIVSIEHFNEFILSGLKEVISIAKERNIPILKHSDGYLWPLLDILVDSGIDALQAIEPAAGMDIGEVKKQYGEKIAVIGNIDCAHLLTFGTKEEVKKATLQCILTASPGGGHVLSSSNIIHKSVPPENFIAMLNTAKEFGRYPIDMNKIKNELKNYN